MQARAIFESSRRGEQEHWRSHHPGGHGPGSIATKAEFDILKAVIDKVAKEVEAASGTSIAYHVGTMIELPRAALKAGEIAKTASSAPTI